MIKRFAVSAYIVHDASVLLGKHVKQQAWVPVGGKIDINESPVDAVQREVLEETGLVFDVDYTFSEFNCFHGNFYRMPGFLAYHEYEAKPSGMHMCFSFMLEAKHRSIKLCNEFTEYKWIPYSEKHAVDPIPPNVYQLLMKCFYHLHRQ